MKKAEQGIADTIVLEGYSIKVLFKEHSVHITNDAALEQLLNEDRERVTASLVHRIKERFRSLFPYDLDISPDSLAVEIWGHVYCARLVHILDNLVQLKLLEKMTDKIISYCEIIDCGETGYDGNRMFWNLLAPFKSTIAGWLPGKGEKEKE